MKKNLYVFQAIRVTDDTFIDFWARQYKYDLEHLYETNISIKPFTNEAIMNL